MTVRFPEKTLLRQKHSTQKASNSTEMSHKELFVVTNADVCSSPESDASSVGSTPSFCRSVASISPMYENEDNLPVATPSAKKKAKKITIDKDEVVHMTSLTAIETSLDDDKYYSLSETEQFEHDRLMIEKNFKSLQSMNKESKINYFRYSAVFGVVYLCLIIASLAYSYHQGNLVSTQIVSLAAVDKPNNQIIENIDKKIIDTQNSHKIYSAVDDTVHCNTILYSRWRGEKSKNSYSIPDILYDDNQDYKIAVQNPTQRIINLRPSSLVSFEQFVRNVNHIVRTMIKKAQIKLTKPLHMTNVLVTKLRAIKHDVIINSRISRLTEFNLLNRLNDLKKILSEDMKDFLLEISTDVI